jgi:hypothetical protein
VNPHDAYATATARLAVLPNILRTRTDDAVRAEKHGATNGEFDARVTAAVKRLQREIDRFEKAIAA